MRLCTLTITWLFLSMLFTLMNTGLFYARKLEEKSQQAFLSYTAKKFIAQSFKKACRGEGFKSLEVWQQTCRSLFKLDSIEYERDREDQNLLYAKWSGTEPYEESSDEAYFRIKGESN